MQDGLPVAVTWGPGEEEHGSNDWSGPAGNGIRQIPTNLEELVALCEKAQTVCRRRYRADAFCRGGRHADRFDFRTDQQRPQWAVPPRRHRRRAAASLPSVLRTRQVSAGTLGMHRRHHGGSGL